MSIPPVSFIKRIQTILGLRSDNYSQTLNTLTHDSAKRVVLRRTDGLPLSINLDLRDMRKISDSLCLDAKKTTKSKSEFLSNMSHEIRTPINAILGMNEMILRECKDDSILSYAKNVESSGKMLLSLINDILDFSKIESGKMELFPVKYQLSSVINDLINMYRPRAEEKGLSFELEIDPRTLEQMLLRWLPKDKIKNNT